MDRISVRIAFNLSIIRSFAAGDKVRTASALIWTRAKRPNGSLPVMVWIYGGGFTNGSGSHSSYVGKSFAVRGVVLVTLNCRMGLFGFMAHPALT
jgi:acetyl esterase/lipase